MTWDLFFNIKLPFIGNITDATGGASMRDLSTVMAGIIYASNSKYKNGLINYLAKVDTSLCYFLFFFSFWFIPIEMDVCALKCKAFLTALFSSMIRHELEAVSSSF